MAEIPPSPQQNRVKALSQLSVQSAISPMLKQAAQVLITQLTGRQIQLTSGQQPVSLNKDGLQGKLQNNQGYQARISSQGQQSLLQFFSSESNLAAEKALLNTQQAQALARLPASLLSPLADTKLAAQAVSLNAVVLSKTSQQLSLMLATDNAKGQQITLPLPQTLADLKPGDLVELNIRQSGKQWQISIHRTAHITGQRAISQGEIKTISQGEIKATSESFSSDPKASPTTTPPAQQSAGLGSSAATSAAANQTPAEIKVAVNKVDLASLLQLVSNPAIGDQSQSPIVNQISKTALLQLIQRMPDRETKNLVKQLQSTTLENLPIQQLRSGKIQLTLQRPQAQLPLNASQLPALQAVNIPVNNTMPADAANAPFQSSQNPVTRVSLSRQMAPQSLETKMANRPAIEQIKPNISRQALSNHIHNMIRQLTPVADSPAQLFQQLNRIEQDLGQSLQGETKQWTEQVLQQIKSALPQAKETDANLVRQMMTTPAMPLSPLQIGSPAPTQGLLGGLMMLLQVSLAGRIQRQQPATQERLHQVIASLMGSAKTTATPKPGSRILQDMAQLEQKNQLLKSIGSMLASHQSNKLASAESSLQGQDVFYYALPVLSANGNAEDLELLVRREPEKQDQSEKAKRGGRTWALSMKLSVGGIGEMLAKARLKGDYLELDFYTSNKDLRNLRLNFLPLLNRRLESLGLAIGKSACQLGKIPESLQAHPYQILETQA